MKKIFLSILIAIIYSQVAMAQIGEPFIHDPSTIVECDGKYYTFGTRGGGLISEDGWSWHDGAVRPGGGCAPDAMKIDDRYLIVWNRDGDRGESDKDGVIYTMWNKTLDPNSPLFEYTPEAPVAYTNHFEETDEDSFAIDAGLLLDPTTGRLWVSHGTYFGTIRISEIDPKTGLRVEGNVSVDVAIDCEAPALMYHNGWYYLLGTHGTCCDGVNSTYNIIVGRSRNVTGPYYDNLGRDMMRGGGKMVINAGHRKTGAGHFGRFIVADGVEKASFHWEADMDMGGQSTLAIHPIVWKNDWPVIEDQFVPGTYDIQSERRGYALELAVDFVRMERARTSRAFGTEGSQAEPLQKIKEQTLEDVIGGWPTGNIDVRCGEYMFRPHQKWTVVPVDGPGYLGGPYYKIVIEGTNRALAAAPNKQVIAVPEFTGAPEQLWRIDMLTDGTYRIMPKAAPGCDEEVCLISVADSTPGLGKFDFNSDNSKWNFKQR